MFRVVQYRMKLRVFIEKALEFVIFTGIVIPISRIVTNKTQGKLDPQRVIIHGAIVRYDYAKAEIVIRIAGHQM